MDSEPVSPYSKILLCNEFAKEKKSIHIKSNERKMDFEFILIISCEKSGL